MPKEEERCLEPKWIEANRGSITKVGTQANREKGLEDGKNRAPEVAW